MSKVVTYTRRDPFAAIRERLTDRLRAEVDEMRFAQRFTAELERELLPANDGVGGFDPRNMGMV